jgi:hypothetical protein
MSNLERTPTSSGNRLKATWSFWVKRNTLNGTSSSRYLFYASSGAQADAVRFNDDDGGDSLRTLFWNGTNNAGFINYDKLRDTSSWQHYLIVYDSTLNTTDNFSNNDQTLERIKIFVNGRRMIETAGNGAQNVGIGTNQLMTLWGNPGIVNALFATDTGSNGALITTFDAYFVDGQALTPDVFGFYKDGKGYISAGSTQATDFRPGQWVPKTPRVIKAQIERNGGFGVNGFYLPMNDSSNFGADFHCEPNSIITLKGEDLPQPRNGAPTTSDAYVSQLRTDPYAANLVLALPFVSSGLCTNGTNVGVNTGFGDYSHIIRGSGSAKVATLNGGISIANTAGYYGSSANFDGSNDRVDFSSDVDYALPGDFTMEMWVNWKSVGNGQLLSAGGGNNPGAFYWQYYSSQFQFGTQTVASDNVVTFTPVANQWYHVAAERKGTVLTQYVNGVAIGASTNVTQSYNQGPLYVGWAGAGYINAYIQDVRVYKGVAKYKGGFDVPKPYTPVGIATWRAVPDTTANNFATLNPLKQTNGLTTLTFSEGNNRIIFGGSSYNPVYSTVGVTTGKYYFECRFNTQYVSPGIGGNNTNPTVRVDSGGIYLNEVLQQSGLTSQASGQIFGIALDRTNSSVQFYLNGSTFGSSQSFSANSGQEIFARIMSQNAGASSDSVWNFGQNPTFSGQVTAGTNADDSGKGLFKYQPPSGFLSLCEDNLPTPAISNPGEYFKTVLYEGDNSSGRRINVGFQPDLVWFKSRNTAVSHVLIDSVRGLGHLNTNSNGTEATSGTLYASGYANNGFDLNDGANSGGNTTGRTYVAWCWKAGGAAVSNTDGSITSVVSVNQDAGFSIVSYTANSDSTATIGHGLGKELDFIIVKNRDDAQVWYVYHSSLGPTYRTTLNSTAASFSVTGIWNGTAPSSTVFSLVQDPTGFLDGDRHIAYCWAEIEGFSKAFSYVGNDSADGPFVFLI